MSPKCGIYVYSFSLKDSEDFQPKGACNFSRLKNAQLSLELIDAPFNKENDAYIYKYDINIYLISYNILRIMGEWVILLLLINTKIDFMFDTSDMNRENSIRESIFSDEEYASLYS